MEYDCQTISFDKTIVTANGVAECLCNDCRTPDCSNPIRKRTVSQMGIQVTQRLWVVGNSVRQVVACKGYIGGQQIHAPI